ncbi:MAG: efflux RND transporter periplasmic adaptor subunit [Rubrivivax sp.]|nr:efflux RND transporter periplasmic adaptor subunit [Betaproteobacteria bacterium]MBP6317375.1 efflux RND transporter periplasmic adaptor subunit [Rubrivivax sp.]MBK7276664.1 efflux RND transporter periplasmic adaptor subunit [Betaproteobacteria bacterium]MBK7458482.1 efflux RND transporter periplasmic adaptor subunit [Betaproteobacteria bacterium]MBK7517107.1 efflux RND transporter periplasmic adaptor subunit [Betaproteobacteria bacterium]
MKKIYTAVAVVGIGLAGAAAWWWQNQPTGAVPVAAAPGAKPGGGAPGAGGAGGRPGGPGGPVGVEVARVEAMTLTDDVQAVGSLKSSQGVMLRPEVSGRIARLGFVEGQRVQRGQLLVQLDDTLQQAQLKQAEAQASIARTNLQRSRELLAQNFVSQSAVDQNAASLQVAEAQVALAQAQLARMRVLAPFDGTAGLKLVDIGDYVKDGADVVNIEDLTALTVQFAVPERYIDRLRVGQPVDVAVDALPGRSFKGRVQAVDSQVDANGRALQVLAQVDNPGALLKPGMFARPRVIFSVREGAVLVPEEALVPLGAQQFVFKIVDGPDGQKLSQRLEAKIGLRLPGKVEIVEGLQAGDVVATAGQTRLLRGDRLPVRVIDISKPAAGGKPGGPGSPAAVAKPGGAASAARQAQP